VNFTKLESYGLSKTIT